MVLPFQKVKKENRKAFLVTNYYQSLDLAVFYKKHGTKSVNKWFKEKGPMR